MRIAVLGGDGYCGWATALYLSGKGHSVAIVDNFVRRQWDHELGAQTLTPIRPLAERLRVWQQLTGKVIDSFVGDVTDYDFLGVFHPRLSARSGGSLRRAALGALLDDRPQARGLHAGEQRRRHAEPAVRDSRIAARLSPGQAGHHGRIRHAQHRHRRRLHHDRAQRPQGRAAVSQAARLVLSPLEGARQPQHRCSPARSGDCAPPI